jgi:hypothetical protein
MDVDCIAFALFLLALAELTTFGRLKEGRLKVEIKQTFAFQFNGQKWKHVWGRTAKSDDTCQTSRFCRRVAACARPSFLRHDSSAIKLEEEKNR